MTMPGWGALLRTMTMPGWGACVTVCASWNYIIDVPKGTFVRRPLRSTHPIDCYGQIYPVPDGDLKQPTDSGNACFGNHNTISGKKIVKAMAAKKIM